MPTYTAALVSALLVLCLTGIAPPWTAIATATQPGAPTATRHDAPPTGNRPVMLGINYPLTGPYSVEGLDQIRAARMAVDEINAAGGILGRPVELVPRDSASDEIKTSINVPELIRAGCDMIFGGSSSAVAITAGNICQNYGVPFFGTLTYSTATTLDNAHRMVFRECSNAWMAAQTLAGWLRSRYAGKRYVYITADYTWGWSTEESLRQATLTQDRRIHPGLRTPLGETDFRKVLSLAAEQEPDVVVLVLFGKDMAYALRQAMEMGLKQKSRIVVPSLTLGMAERAGPEAMEGVVGTLPWTWKLPYRDNNPRGIRFVEDFVHRYRRYPSTSGASAYTIVYEYKAAAERAGSFASADIVRALEGHTYTLLKGAQTWRALDHQSVQSMYMVKGNDRITVRSDPLRLNFYSIIMERSGENTVRPETDWKRERALRGLPDHLEPLPQ